VTKRTTEPDDWSAQSSALFDAARGAHAPSAADRERVRDALAQKLASATVVPTTTGDAQGGLTGAGMSQAAIGKLTKVGLGVALTLVGAAAFLRMGDSRERTEAKPAAVQTDSPAAGPVQRAAELDVAARVPAATPDVAVRAPAASSDVAPASATEAQSQDAVPARPDVALTPAADARAQGAVPARTGARRPTASSTPAKVSASARTPDTAHTAEVDVPALVESGRPPSPPPDAPADRDEDAIRARAELEFVARINAAVRTSAPRTVLALCAEHERRWPHGMFEQEREGARAIASCRAKLAGAAIQVRAFLATYPRTAVAARVRDECAPLLESDADRAGALP
jgi:hypothetical protein